MKLGIIVKFNSGEEKSISINAADWRKWENKTGKTIGDRTGVNDWMTLAHFAVVRENAGAKPMKPFEAWCDTIDDIDILKDGASESPKATESEA